MNINNGKTGNVNIPGPLHSTGGDGDGQVGGVVAYAGDVYDETLGKNQKEINQTLLDGSADSNVIAVALNDLNEKVEEQEKVTSSGLNDLNDKTDNLGKDIEDLEKTTSSSLNDLKDKVDNLSDEISDNEKTTASALTDLDEKTDNNEKAVSAALNDLNDKIDNSTQSASNVLFDDSVAHLGTTLTSVDTVQKAINVIAIGVAGNIGKLIIKLLYPNSTPVTNKEVSITAYYRGNSFDLSPQYTPDFSGFKTDNNGYVVNADGGEFISLPLGATYTIHYTNISDSYLTPEDTTGVINSSEKTINNIYQNVSENEFVYFYVQMPNSLASAVTPVNKVITVDTYSTPTIHALAYKCILRENGTIKQILNADDTQATYNGNPLISDNEPVLLPIPTGTKYLSSLQLWDPSLSENEQRYVKSSDIIYTASKAKRTVKFEYLDNQVGIFLIIVDTTTAKGYRACLVTDIDTTNSKIFFKDGDYTYEAYLSNSVLYRKLENDVASEVWEETILGYGIKTSTTILNANDDSATSSEYPNCSFIMPKNATTLKGALSSANVSINIPVNFGGLFVSACYNELSGDTNSPLINRLLNNGEEAWVLTTTGGTKTIKGFAATLHQVNVIKGVINQVNTINNILFGTNYTYAKTGVASIHPITLVNNNGANTTSNGSTIANLIASTLDSGNPQQAIIANTNLNIVVLYPFS